MPNPTPSIVERLRSFPTNALQLMQLHSDAADKLEEQQRTLERVGEAVEEIERDSEGLVAAGAWVNNRKAAYLDAANRILAALHNDKGGEGE